MSRCIKVAITHRLLERTEESLKSFLANKPDVTLSFVGVPGDPEAITLQKLKDTFSDIEVAVVDPSLLRKLSDCIPSCTKWIQSTWAGVDILQKLNEEQRIRMKNCMITRAGGVFPPRMAEYVVGAVISMERNFPLFYKRQLKKEWRKETNYRTLTQLSIGILGIGEVGREVAKACRTLGMTVYGLKRTPGACEHVEKVFAPTELAEFLEVCDYVCNILPETSETRGLLSGNILKPCAAKNPGFINIGRGSVICEESLVAALKNGWISKAFLDVFQTEPLGKSSALWSMENVTITPHVAGVSLEHELVTLFFSNLDKYINGIKLDYVYDWERGY